MATRGLNIAGSQEGTCNIPKSMHRGAPVWLEHSERRDQRANRAPDLVRPYRPQEEPYFTLNEEWQDLICE